MTNLLCLCVNIVSTYLKPLGVSSDALSNLDTFTGQVTMKWEKLKPPEPDEPFCCCECDFYQSRCCCDCEDLDEAFHR